MSEDETAAGSPEAERDPTWGEAAAAFEGATPVELARSPRRVTVVYRHENGMYRATSPELALFREAGEDLPRLREIVAERLGAFLDPAVEVVETGPGEPPPAAEMRYDDEEPGKVTRVLVRVDYADGRIREYEALEPEGFEINDPEADLSLGSMRMGVQSGGSPFVPMVAAVWALRLKFRANPRRMAEIRTERTARPRE